MADSPGWVQSFGAYADAIHDAAATENAKRILEIVEALFCRRIPGVRQKPVCLQQSRGTDEFIRIPPEAWT